MKEIKTISYKIISKITHSKTKEQIAEILSPLGFTDQELLKLTSAPTKMPLDRLALALEKLKLEDMIFEIMSSNLKNPID